MKEFDQDNEIAGIRINKYLVSCGYESRRKADKLVAEGLVEINGQCAEAGARVKTGDFVKVNGKQVKPKVEVTLLLNKPRGIVCSRESQGAEGTVYDLLPTKYKHVNYVGRLDADSEGLLLLTSKGDFSDRITQPKSHVEKEYWVTLNQPYDNDTLLQLLKGLRLPEGQARVKYVARLSPRRACVVLEQGLKRQIRQMFACLGLRVRKLVRVRIGSLWGGDLLPGHFTVMTPEQMELALANPKRRKGLIGANQVFSSSNKLTAEQLDEKLDVQVARAALLDETDYQFNPDDFESEDEAANSAFERYDEREEDFPKRRPLSQKKTRPAPGRTRETQPRRGKYDAPDGRKRPFGKYERNAGEGRPRRFEKRRDGARAERPLYGDFRRGKDGDERPFHRGKRPYDHGAAREESRGRGHTGNSRKYGNRGSFPKDNRRRGNFSRPTQCFNNSGRRKRI